MTPKQPPATATSRTSAVSKAGKDRRRGFARGSATTYVSATRAGIRLPNEDVGNTITREEYLRERA